MEQTLLYQMDTAGHCWTSLGALVTFQFCVAFHRFESSGSKAEQTITQGQQKNAPHSDDSTEDRQQSAERAAWQGPLRSAFDLGCSQAGCPPEQALE